MPKASPLLPIYLDAQGHDTAKAFADWNAKNPNTNSPVAK